MAKPDKKKPLIKWLKHIKESKSIHSRRYFTIPELHQLYCSTKLTDDETLSMTSFKRLIDSIYANKLYANLKRKDTGRFYCESGYKRGIEYIIVQDNEIKMNTNDICVYVTRKHKSEKTDYSHKTSLSSEQSEMPISSVEVSPANESYIPSTVQQLSEPSKKKTNQINK